MGCREHLHYFCCPVITILVAEMVIECVIREFGHRLASLSQPFHPVLVFASTADYDHVLQALQMIYQQAFDHQEDLHHIISFVAV